MSGSASFQSTCPARGTTDIEDLIRKAVDDFNPRAPRGARPCADRFISPVTPYFNPRAPRGARRQKRRLPVVSLKFQSTCPARGTTRGAAGGIPAEGYFNPRAPRGARRTCRAGCWHNSRNFNPRAPRGARLEIRRSPLYLTIFQSTCPARGTTPEGCGHRLPAFAISIHVPREGHDGQRDGDLLRVLRFQSTCPARGTTVTLVSFITPL